MSPKINIELLEIDEADGEAVYYHAEDCPSYCDFACNGITGDLIASAYNMGRNAQQSVQRNLLTPRPEIVATKQNILNALEEIKQSQIR